MARSLILLVTCWMGFTAVTTTNESPEPSSDREVRTLYIVRHAKSVDETAGVIDFDRGLEEKGVNNSKAVGSLMKRKFLSLDFVLCSPSKRTYETARIISEAAGFPVKDIRLDSSIYRCTFETYYGIVSNLNDSLKSVMVVGHNPATTQLANRLQKKEQISDVPTGGIVAIQFSGTWREAVTNGGKLLFFFDPDDITEQTD